MSDSAQKLTRPRSWAVIAAGALFGVAERGFDLYQQAGADGDAAAPGAQLLGGAIAGGVFGIAASRLLRRLRLIA
jgi:hypothetical protein